MTRLIVVLAAFLVTWPAAWGADSPSAPEFQASEMKRLVKDLGKGQFQIGEVKLNKPARTIQFPAKVNLRDVLIEYAIVGKIGKLHESLLSTQIPPTHIHIAMLLLGTKNLRPKSHEDSLPPGNPIDIFIDWESEGTKQRARIEDWIIVEKDKRPIPKGMWVYSGARVDNGYFTANTDESIVAIILDIDALVNNARLGNENDEIWFPNEAKIPALGTPVTVTFQLLDTYTIPATENKAPARQ